MAFLLDRDSAPGATSLVDLFSVPTTQTVINHSYWYAAHPVNTITSDGPYQFNVSAGPDYLHLGKNYLCMKLRIVNSNGDALDDTASVAPINLLGKTFFKQVKVGINGKVAYDSGPMYAYRSFLETELNYNGEAKRNHLSAGLYERDGTQLETASNAGFIKRAAKFAGSNTVELIAPIHCDLFLSDRLLISHTQVQLELHRNSDKFALLSFNDNSAYKIEVVDMVWYVKKIQLAPSIHMAIEATLMKNPVKYPIRRVVMTKLQIGTGRHCVPTSSIFEGQIPRRIVVGFVGTTNFFGAYNKSPFLFGHNNVSEIYIEAGGQNYPREPLKLDFPKKHYARAYLHLVDALGLMTENRTNDISLEDFENTRCLFCFDLSQDDADSTNWELIREGTTIVHCTFAEAIKDPGVEMVVFGEFDNVAMLDRHRTIYYDYTV